MCYESTLKVQKGTTCGLALLLLYEQHYHKGLHAVEKHLLHIAMETLMHEKQENIGILNALEHLHYPQHNKDCIEKKSDNYSLQNNNRNADHKLSKTGQDKTNARINENEWITKGKMLRRHSFPPNNAAFYDNNNICEILCDRGEDSTCCRNEENNKEMMK